MKNLKAALLSGLTVFALALTFGGTEASAQPREYLKIICHTQGAADVSATVPLNRANDGTWNSDLQIINIGSIRVIPLFSARASEFLGLLKVETLGFASELSPGIIQSYAAFGNQRPGSLYLRAGTYATVAMNRVTPAGLERYDYCSMAANVVLP